MLSFTGQEPARIEKGFVTMDARHAYDRARPGHQVIGWKVEEISRRELLQLFPPSYANIVADHVTLKAKVAADAALPGEVAGEIIGRADDGQGVEAMIVRLDGGTDRPDGSTYHITWSLGPGRRAVESNDVIRDRGWEPLDLPQSVALIPARF
jgi:hypothetical protein